LHGYGDEPTELRTALTPVSQRMHAAVGGPTGPVATTSGPAWFPSEPNDEGPPLHQTLEALRALSLEACLANRLDRDDVSVFGWSQGGATALALALGGGADWRPHAVVGLAAWLPDEPDVRWDFAGSAAAGVRVLLVHGSDDHVVPFPQARSATRVLERHGVDVTLIEVRAGHDLSALLEPAVRWLAAAG
jgi:predicted esterase